MLVCGCGSLAVERKRCARQCFRVAEIRSLSLPPWRPCLGFFNLKVSPQTAPVAAPFLPPPPEQAASTLLRAATDDYGSLYGQHLFEQYKLAVEMADRVSARRMQANTFFLGVNTGLLTVFAALVKDKVISGWTGALPVIALLVLCFVWWRIVRSYRQLNSGKYQIIRQMEALLPAAPYAAEWEALGEGHDPKRYLPLTHVENWVPRLFFVLVLGLLLAVLFVDQAPAVPSAS